VDITTGILILIVSFFAGGYGTIVGAGGGFILVPALLLLFNLSPAVAAGTGLVIVLINSLTGVVGYSRQKRIDYRTGLKIAIGAIPGSIFGVWLLQVQPNDSIYFYLLFGTLLFCLGGFLFFKNAPASWREKLPFGNKEESHHEQTAFSLTAAQLIPLGVVMGMLSSYLGIGGGWLLVPILIYIYRMPTHQATATSICSLCLYTSVGVLSQLYYQTIDWVIIMWGAVGVIAGAYVGVRVAKKVSGPIILQMLSVLLMIIGVRMIIP